MNEEAPTLYNFRLSLEEDHLFDIIIGKDGFFAVPKDYKDYFVMGKTKEELLDYMELFIRQMQKKANAA